MPQTHEQKYADLVTVTFENITVSFGHVTLHGANTSVKCDYCTLYNLTT